MAKPKPYTDYPQQYFKIIEHFQTSNDSISFPAKARQVQSTRKSFYRFLSALTSSIASNPSYIQGLLNVSRDLVLCLRPIDARGDEEAELMIELNPICDRIISPDSFPPPGGVSSDTSTPIPHETTPAAVEEQHDILDRITGRGKIGEKKN